MQSRRTEQLVGALFVLVAIVAAVWAGQRFFAGEAEAPRPGDQATPRPAAGAGNGPEQGPETMPDSGGEAEERTDPGRSKTEEKSPFAEARRRMIEEDLRGRDITDPKVLRAMQDVPRHRFVAETLTRRAYDDHPLPIGHGQTISQPYIVALMTQLAECGPETKALDIGTGSGYQAAVLAEICKEVYGIEIVPELAKEAEQRLDALGYDNVTVRHGDGYRGWPEHAPFDAIIVAAAPGHVPEPLVEQLAPGGRLVIPVGDFYQELLLIEKQKDGSVRRKKVTGVAFVPMTGEAQKSDR